MKHILINGGLSVFYFVYNRSRADYQWIFIAIKWLLKMLLRKKNKLLKKLSEFKSQFLNIFLAKQMFQRDVILIFVKNLEIIDKFDCKKYA